ncbi:hypothetical protein POVCU2_0024050 [Plasmodium ovale curtisi]|uniref:Uncharacterized protein n=1 Tax=Plasmodium ovale curtisi TaxID=864141 RepID=A0A1A8VWF3_PLAOA|nr:hypothetical protein POVCU2_0024050 [Plasmodium ovale curtisi]SBS92086.1 hypothetical protein POVCU1_021890 [Plasmodium ovale curtisi]
MSSPCTNTAQEKDEDQNEANKPDFSLSRVIARYRTNKVCFVKYWAAHWMVHWSMSQTTSEVEAKKCTCVLFSECPEFVLYFCTYVVHVRAP